MLGPVTLLEGIREDEDEDDEDEEVALEEMGGGGAFDDEDELELLGAAYLMERMSGAAKSLTPGDAVARPISLGMFSRSDTPSSAFCTVTK